MARELGMNPKGFGKIANHNNQPWKVPLPEFIEDLYFKRFKKESPDNVLSFEQLNANFQKKKAQKKAKKATVGLTKEPSLGDITLINTM